MGTIYRTLYKYLRLPVLIVGFYIVINWATDFKFLSPRDIQLIAILITGTILLLLISNSDLHIRIKERFRFNLFFMGIIQTLMTLMRTGSDSINGLRLGIFMSMKPLVYSLIIYVIGNNIIVRFEGKKHSAQDPKEVLTRREYEIYALIIEGRTNKEMSESLYIAETTVKKHVQNILKKLNADGKEEIIQRKR